MSKLVSLTITVPALNEEQNLKTTLEGIVKVLGDSGIDWEIILVNDGSTDKTGDIANELASQEPRIKVIHHKQPKGIGYCFREGIQSSTKDAITWLPGDGENNPYELLKYLPILEHVDIVIPFVLNVGVRSWGRRFLSTLYIWLINLSFGTMFNYSNGTAIYRRSVFQVVKPQANGFFFPAESLIKAVRAGFIFAEVPVRLEKRLEGYSKLMSFKSLCLVIWEFIRLFYAVHILRTAGRGFGAEVKN
jgi:glycosyltransferase involved in cell wall biosynthesis